MRQCSTKTTLDFHPEITVELTADAPEISSDAGWLLLRSIDDDLGLSSLFATFLPDERDPLKLKHSRREQLRQRLFQIAAGYEDCNDADALRHDPLLKTVSDRTPDDDQGLSSQPTLCRFENAVTMATVRKMTRCFEQSYVEALPEDTSLIILDIDTTDDPTHGLQQLALFHGYYDQHMYHPLLIFDGLTGQLITVMLRPGTKHASCGALGLIRRVIRLIKQRLPRCQVILRADSGFCVPRILDGLEKLDAELGQVDYVLGLAKNKVLLRKARGAMELAEACFESSHRHIRHFDSFHYAAKTWSRTRHVVVKAEHGRKGANPRFVVSTLGEFPPRLIYDGYCGRGQCENFIKDLKNGLFADRLSCHSFVANSFRLLLHCLVYRLMFTLRQRVAEQCPELGHVQFDTLRLRLLKVAAQVRQSVRRIWVRLSVAFPLKRLFFSLLDGDFELRTCGSG